MQVVKCCGLVGLCSTARTRDLAKEEWCPGCGVPAVVEKLTARRGLTGSGRCACSGEVGAPRLCAPGLLRNSADDGAAGFGREGRLD